MSSNYLYYYTSAFIFLCLCILAQYIGPFRPNREDILRLLFTYQHQAASSALESSLWCHQDTDGHKLCSFKNLCYAPLEEQFIFILSNNSILSGIESKHDLKALDLSSVSGHNRFIMKLAIVSQEHTILKRRVILESSAYVMSRFKPDNIMHVIHDDLLPLFVTYSNLCLGDVVKCASQYRLVFVDNGESNGSFSEWYWIFSKSEPFALHKGDKSSIICFEEARVGLCRSSVWFQYGFGTVQGPLNSTQLKGNVITQFANFVVKKLNIQPMCNTGNDDPYDTIVLFSRKISRKILNEDVLVRSIVDTYREVYPNSQKLKTFILDLSVNNTKTMLSILLESKLVVGMHGAELILSIFLPEGAALVELFPFGIKPCNVSPLKSLSRITGTRLIYESWVNMDENNTLTHPEASALLGGIQHLPSDKQAEIMSATSIPRVACCHDPAYLYRMFQDTIVGPDFVTTLKRALRFQIHFSKDVKTVQTSSWWFPSPVNNITCSFTSSTLSLRWNPSLNIEDTVASYKVTVTAADMHLDFVVVEAQLIINCVTPIIPGTYFNVWIKCVAPEFDVDSLDSYLECIAPFDI